MAKPHLLSKVLNNILEVFFGTETYNKTYESPKSQLFRAGINMGLELSYEVSIASVIAMVTEI